MNEISIAINLPTIILLSIMLLVMGVCLFLIGYFLGKQINSGVSYRVENKPISFFDNKINKPNKIVIDDKTHVAEINTDNLEKKYDSLGDIKKSDENISSSINKLKNMKRSP